MGRTKSELLDHARRLGIDVAGTNETIMDTLRDEIVKREGLDIVQQVPVMLAQNAKEMLNYDLEKPWTTPEMMKLFTSPDWIMEPKLDGVRVKAHFEPGDDTFPRLDSRRRSDTNYVYAEKTANFPHLQLDMSKLPPEFGDMLLDGELIPPNGVKEIQLTLPNNSVQTIKDLNISTAIWNSGRDTAQWMQQFAHVPNPEYPAYSGCYLQYHVFDILRLAGQDMTQMPWYKRTTIRELVLAEIQHQNPHYQYVPHYGADADRLDVFEKILLNGDEGVMFKRIDGKVEPGKRVKHVLKLKRFETVDAFVFDFVPATIGKANEGLIGAFKLGVYDQDNVVHVASISGIDMQTRRDATTSDGGLNPAYHGRVCEVRFQQLTQKNFRGKHAIFVRWREDKTPNDCKIDQIPVQASEVMDES